MQNQLHLQQQQQHAQAPQQQQQQQQALPSRGSQGESFRNMADYFGLLDPEESKRNAPSAAPQQHQQQHQQQQHMPQQDQKHVHFAPGPSEVIPPPQTPGAGTAQSTDWTALYWDRMDKIKTEYGPLLASTYARFKNTKPDEPNHKRFAPYAQLYMRISAKQSDNLHKTYTEVHVQELEKMHKALRAVQAKQLHQAAQARQQQLMGPYAPTAGASVQAGNPFSPAQSLGESLAAASPASLAAASPADPASSMGMTALLNWEGKDDPTSPQSAPPPFLHTPATQEAATKLLAPHQEAAGKLQPSEATAKAPEAANAAAALLATVARASAESKADVAKALRSALSQQERDRRRDLESVVASWPEGLHRTDASQQRPHTLPEAVKAAMEELRGRVQQECTAAQESSQGSLLTLEMRVGVGYPEARPLILEFPAVARLQGDFVEAESRRIRAIKALEAAPLPITIGHAAAAWQNSLTAAA
ncbi:hypothetical protein WJX73_002324 [Symbiochloris irregularis]|uniref:Uncharacterized protein n=1 Tax=Symbiochloris irregularis TaxID=706552 RepID=A0AAW1PZL8_9CHLO